MGYDIAIGLVVVLGSVLIVLIANSGRALDDAYTDGYTRGYNAGYKHGHKDGLSDAEVEEDDGK